MGTTRRVFLQTGLILWVVAVMMTATGCGEKAVVRPRQTKCPLTGNRCNRDYSIIIDGCRVYGCSPACIPSIKANPQKYIDKIRANGEEPDKLEDIKVDRSAGY